MTELRPALLVAATLLVLWLMPPSKLTRRWRRRWALCRCGTWRTRWVRCRLCRRIYCRDIWPKPVPRPSTHGLWAPRWLVRLPCGHTVAEADTGDRGARYA